MSQTQSEVLELYRAGLKGALDWMQASLENAERLQNQQLNVFRGALDAQLQAASELGAMMSTLYEKQMTSLKGARKEKTSAH